MANYSAEGPTWAEAIGKLSGGGAQAGGGGGIQATYDGPGLLDIILKPIEAELEAG